MDSDPSEPAATLAPVLIYQNKEDIEPYNKIVVPSSMRSIYWKFFGFPANKHNEITNKQRIVCAICGTTIAYNKNTTNLQTHLNTRHPEIVKEYFPNERSSSAKRRVSASLRPAEKAKRIKVETIDSESWNTYTNTKIKTISPQPHPTGILVKAAVQTALTDVRHAEYDDQDGEEEIIEEFEVHQNEFMECDDIETVAENLEYADTEEQPNTFSTKDQSFSIHLMNVDRIKLPKDKQCKDSADESNRIGESFDGRASVEDKSKQPELDHANICNHTIDITEETAKFIVTDLLPVDLVEGKGFQLYINSLAKDIVLPTAAEIRENLSTAYNKALASTISGLQSILRNQYYSISLEKWNSRREYLDDAEFLSVFVNYLDANENDNTILRSQILCIDKGPFSQEFWEKQVESNITNTLMCKGVVVNFELDDKLKIYFKSKQIPIVDDFPTAISRVIYKCLRIEDVSRALRDIHSWFENQSTDDDLIEQPKFTNELWHAQYNLMLHYVKKEKDVKDCIIRKVFDLITPLKNCLDILSQEQRTLASVMVPLTQELISQHYSLEKTDLGTIDYSIKELISAELKENILNNWFLTVAAFLDPRFQTFEMSNNFHQIKAYLEKECGVHTSNADGSKAKIAAAETTQSTSRKSGLSSLFASNKLQPTSSPKNKFDVEFLSYKNVNIDIESCPLQWWNESAKIYPNIGRIAQQYNCVPCSVGDGPIFDKMEYFNKRRFLATELERKILWLHSFSK